MDMQYCEPQSNDIEKALSLFLADGSFDCNVPVISEANGNAALPDFKWNNAMNDCCISSPDCRTIDDLIGDLHQDIGNELNCFGQSLINIVHKFGIDIRSGLHADGVDQCRELRNELRIAQRQILMLEDQRQVLETENQMLKTDNTRLKSQQFDDKEQSPSQKGEASLGKKQRKRIEALESTIVRGDNHSQKSTFEGIAGLVETKKALHQAVVLPSRFPHLFQGNRRPWRCVLLYGPPGTGKSRLARSLASEIQSPLYSVSSSDLISSWVGESEKLVRDLFQSASTRSDNLSAAIFIDEIDSICRNRSKTEDEYVRRVKNELLKQMENLNNNDSSVFLLCATNRPWELDAAFLGRFQRRIYVPLPDFDARVELFNIHMDKTNCGISQTQLLQLAKITDGFSGRDIYNLITAALYEPINDIEDASEWRLTEDGKYIPQNTSGGRGDGSKGFADVIKARLGDLAPSCVETRKVEFWDFERCLRHHRFATVSPTDLEAFEQFTADYGQMG